MTKYQPTKQDRDDKKRIAAIDDDLRQLSALKGEAGAVSGTAGSRIIVAIEQEVDRLAEQRRRIVREGEQRIKAFYGDRAKVRRAFAALRKDGFATSMTEPSFESERMSDKLRAAVEAGEPYAFVRRNEVEYAFGQRDGYYGRKTESADPNTLVRDLHVMWGPTDADTQVTAFGKAIERAFEAEGFKVEWNGNGWDTVTVKATTE